MLPLVNQKPAFEGSPMKPTDPSGGGKGAVKPKRKGKP